MSEEYKGNNEGGDETDIAVFNASAMNVFFDMMKSSTPPPANDLQPLQKRLPMTYQALLNGHGDYGYGRRQRAFMTSPRLEIHDDGQAAVKFPDLPRPTTRVELQGSALPRPICLDVSWHESRPHVGQGRVARPVHRGIRQPGRVTGHRHTGHSLPDKQRGRRLTVP